MAGQVIAFGKHRFPSKAALKKAIKQEIDPYPLNTIFTSDLVSDLILWRHPYCCLKILRPERFRKGLPHVYRAYYYFQGDFPQAGGWHGIAWHKAVDQPTYEDEVKGFLRWNLAPVMAEARGTHCEQCGATANLQTDHLSPTFDEMYRAASCLLTPKEINTWAYYDWDTTPGFRLPRDHPVLKSVMAAHQTAKLQTLCTSCHSKETKARKHRP